MAKIIKNPEIEDYIVEIAYEEAKKDQMVL